LHFVAVDLRGHGRSEHTRDGFTTERFAEDMLEVAGRPALFVRRAKK
jgi:pimeloyl-ACP methyl ester carboxylesterase